MQPIIKIQNLSKMYRLGVIGTGTLSHDLNRWWHKVRGKEDPYLKIGEANVSDRKSDSDYVWALKDINLEVMPGEVLGIIGKNGAGKSTLLKILSRVTGPTTGKITYRGRIGSLLEVGTGFHSELTGRENIFLNGAILGMTKAEIRSKLDEIVDFAGVERYIDTPVKRYSSGMMVRLGFAVAAHLEPEILVVDEVLAVGDAEFQKKAISKMKNVSYSDGKTILFVSHNMSSIQNLCSSCLVLDSGTIKIPVSETAYAVEKYLQNEKKKSISRNFNERKDRNGDGALRFDSYQIDSEGKGHVNTIQSGKRFTVTLKYTAYKSIKSPVDFDISIVKQNGEQVTVLSTRYLNKSIRIHKGKGKISFTIPKLPLTEGEYRSNIFSASSDGIHDWIQEAIFFNVVKGDYYETDQFVKSMHNSTLFDFEINY